MSLDKQPVSGDTEPSARWGWESEGHMTGIKLEYGENLGCILSTERIVF